MAKRGRKPVPENDRRTAKIDISVTKEEYAKAHAEADRLAVPLASILYDNFQKWLKKVAAKPVTK